MSTDRTPKPGQAFRSPKGSLVLYVRTEKRPGRSTAEQLFVRVDPERRLVMEWWRPADQPLPEELELAMDPLAVERAQAAENELTWIVRERDALAAAMKEAVRVVPVDTANYLRRVFRETLA